MTSPEMSSGTMAAAGFTLEMVASAFETVEAFSMMKLSETVLFEVVAFPVMKLSESVAKSAALINNLACFGGGISSILKKQKSSRNYSTPNAYAFVNI